MRSLLSFSEAHSRAFQLCSTAFNTISRSSLSSSEAHLQEHFLVWGVLQSNTVMLYGEVFDGLFLPISPRKEASRTHPENLIQRISDSAEGRLVGGVLLFWSLLAAFFLSSGRFGAPILFTIWLLLCLSTFVSPFLRCSDFSEESLWPKGVGEEGVGEKLNRVFSGFFPWQVRPF